MENPKVTGAWLGDIYFGSIFAFLKAMLSGEQGRQSGNMLGGGKKAT